LRRSRSAAPVNTCSVIWNCLPSRFHFHDNHQAAFHNLRFALGSVLPAG
jgi:hypothetical protein